ncbi:MAG: hypothetical protein M3N45_15415 [Actinomycetota bacterium]|nr:hypothetical protein [Actinomycetota bacterium]
MGERQKALQGPFGHLVLPWPPDAAGAAHPGGRALPDDVTAILRGGVMARATLRFSPTVAEKPGIALTCGAPMNTDHDLWVDFTRMRDDGRVLTRLRDAKRGFVPIAGSYVTVGCEDAEPAVARILWVDSESTIEVEVLPGSVEEHRDLLTSPY